MNYCYEWLYINSYKDGILPVLLIQPSLLYSFQLWQ